MTDLGTVAQIWRYPVSSLRGEQLASAPLDEAGIEGDRRWGVVDAVTGSVANPTERRWRTIPELIARGTSDAPEIQFPSGEWLPARGAPGAAALSTYFGFPAEVRRHVPFETASTAETVAPRYRRAQIHILTTASMNALRERVPPGTVVDPRRFRPNILVDTASGIEGFAEFDWMGRQIAVGDAVFRVKEPCERCAFTTLAQGDLPFQREVLSGIVRHGGGGFGVLCEVLERRDISEGDTVRLL